MPEMYLVRHGSFDGMSECLPGRCDVGLNHVGREEAMRAAASCQRLSISSVFSSPRRRARETAAIIAQQVGADVEVLPDFDEVDYGLWTGRSFSDLANDPDWRRFNEARDSARIPSGESLATVSDRIRKGLGQIGQRDALHRVAIVTHAEIIRCALLLAESRSWSSWSLFQPQPASVTPLRWRLSA